MPIHESLCETIRNQIDDLTRSDLRDVRLPTPVTEHTRNCPACKAYLNDILGLAEHLEDWPVPEPGKNIETGVMTRIAQLERDRRFDLLDIAGQCRGLLVRRVRVPVALAALLLLGLFVSVALNVRAWQERAAYPVFAGTETVPSLPTAEGGMVQMPHVSPVVATPQPQVQVSGSQQGLPSLIGHSQLAPTTFIIILGAPPLPAPQGVWTSRPLRRAHSAL